MNSVGKSTTESIRLPFLITAINFTRDRKVSCKVWSTLNYSGTSWGTLIRRNSSYSFFRTIKTASNAKSQIKKFLLGWFGKTQIGIYVRDSRTIINLNGNLTRQTTVLNGQSICRPTERKKMKERPYKLQMSLKLPLCFPISSSALKCIYSTDMPRKYLILW